MTESVTGSCSSPDRNDACLFSFNDFPVMHALDLYQEAAYTDNHGHQTT